MTNETSDFKAPYIPWKTLFNLFERMEEKGAPNRIDRSYLPTLAGNDQSYLISALKGFGLIDEDGRVLPAMHPFISKSTRPGAVKGLLETFYREAVVLPQNATQQELDETFREHYHVQGDSARKAQTFYLRAAEYAGIGVSANFKNPAGAASGGGSRPRRARSARSQTRRDPVVDLPPAPPTPAPLDNALQMKVHPMLHGAMVWISENGPRWTDAMAEAWIASFTGQVRLVYPGRKTAPSSKPKSGDGEEPE